MARTARVVDRDLGFAQIISETAKFRNAEILIGFQAGDVTHAQSKRGREKPAGLSMPEIAAQNEFGFGRIPARSFMRTSFDENLTRIYKAITIQYNKIQDGKSNADDALGKIGQFVQGLIQKKIRQITYPPNSPATIAIKGSSKPLIDFGQMIQSVRYKIRKS